MSVSLNSRLVADKPSPWRVYLALTAASILWGSLYTAAKPAVATTGPIQVTLCRVVLACVCLGLLTVLRGNGHMLVDQFRANWRGILILGWLNFGLSQLLALSALQFLPASVNGVLNNTHPLWVAVATAVFYPPRNSVLLVGGSVVALVGVCLVFLPDLLVGAFSGATSFALTGVALALAGSGVIALGTIVGRRVMRSGDPIAVSALASATAIVPLTGFTVLNGGFSPIFEAAGSIKLLLVYVGVGCTAINFALWYYGLKHLRAAPASAFQYLIPPVGVALAAAFLGEPIGVSLLLGTACIVGGLAATQVGSS